MLYDPAQDMPQLLTVARFKLWLDQQPSGERYDYILCGCCALAQYLQAKLGGIYEIEIQPDCVRLHMDEKVKEYPLSRVLDDIVVAGPNTFGAAAARAAAALALI